MYMYVSKSQNWNQCQPDELAPGCTQRCALRGWQHCDGQWWQKGQCRVDVGGCKEWPSPDSAVPGSLLNVQWVLADKETLMLCTRGPTIPLRDTGELPPLPTLWHQILFAQTCIFHILTTMTALSRVRRCCFTDKTEKLLLHRPYNKWIGPGLQTEADVYEDLRNACQGSLFWTRSCLVWWTTFHLGPGVF